MSKKEFSHNGLLAYILGLIVIISLISTVHAAPIPQAATSVQSWNPKVPCSAIIVQISDITAGQTGSNSFNNSPFTPGTTAPSGYGSDAAKRWLSSGGSTPSGWVAPGPPCTVTNSKGTTSLYVQINGVKRGSITEEDQACAYHAINGGTSHSCTNDGTMNLFDPTHISNYDTSCSSTSDPTCAYRIHVEIDHDWKAAGYCGTGTTCDDNLLSSQTSRASTLIDVQGYVYWDAGGVSSQYHQYSGWELHPLTGWRLSGQTGSDTTPPSWPAGSTLTASGITSSSVTLSWTSATDNVGVTGYKLYRGGTLVASLGTVQSYTVTGLSPNTSYTFKVEACDAAGNCSTTGPSTTVTTLTQTTDTNAPTWPAGSTLTLTNRGKKGISLDWTAATDNVGVTNYRVYMNGVLVHTLGNVLSDRVNGLGSGTYTFKIEAGDAAGNWSTTGPSGTITK